VLRKPLLTDAPLLFPMVYRTSVIEQLFWDGPESAEEFTATWSGIVGRAERGENHFFVITEPSKGAAVGACDVRPDEKRFRGSLGIWIGEAYQGQGLGTQAIGELVRYAWGTLRLHRLDAEVFVGNWPSRVALEKNGFVLEGTLRSATLKLGVLRDDWCFGLINPASPFLGPKHE
jgi:RimJ/RimL family protein N-acetyltransferase